MNPARRSKRLPKILQAGYETGNTARKPCPGGYRRRDSRIYRSRSDDTGRSGAGGYRRGCPLAVVDCGGEVLAVSQFTLTASTKKGNRPSYIRAAGHELAVPLYEDFCRLMEELTGKSVARGRFGADMQVSLLNDGPVTIIMDSRLKE